MRDAFPMNLVNDALGWYQGKIGNYDKQSWEQSVEQRILQGLENRPKKEGSLNDELIDVDLVRGSAFSKAKPQHGIRAVLFEGIGRVLFMPLCYTYWRQHTSTRIARFLLLHYCLQLVQIVAFLFEGQDEVSQEEVWAPLLLSLALGVLHTQISSTHGNKKSKKRTPSGTNTNTKDPAPTIKTSKRRKRHKTASRSDSNVEADPYPEVTLEPEPTTPSRPSSPENSIVDSPPISPEEEIRLKQFISAKNKKIPDPVPYPIPPKTVLHGTPLISYYSLDQNSMGSARKRVHRASCSNDRRVGFRDSPDRTNLVRSLSTDASLPGPRSHGPIIENPDSPPNTPTGTLWRGLAEFQAEDITWTPPGQRPSRGSPIRFADGFNGRDGQDLNVCSDDVFRTSEELQMPQDVSGSLLVDGEYLDGTVRKESPTIPEILLSGPHVYGEQVVTANQADSGSHGHSADNSTDTEDEKGATNQPITVRNRFPNLVLTSQHSSGGFQGMQRKSRVTIRSTDEVTVSDPTDLFGQSGKHPRRLQRKRSLSTPDPGPNGNINDIAHVVDSMDLQGGQDSAGASSNEDTFTSNSRQRVKFERLFRIRSEAIRRAGSSQDQSIREEQQSSPESENDQPPARELLMPRPASHKFTVKTTNAKDLKAPSFASQASETEYDRMNSDVGTDDSSSVSEYPSITHNTVDTADTEVLPQQEDPFVLWYKETHLVNTEQARGTKGPTAYQNIASRTQTVSCYIWENNQLKKADLTLLDIGWSIIQAVEQQSVDTNYARWALFFACSLSFMPIAFRIFHQRENLFNIPHIFTQVPALHAVAVDVPALVAGSVFASSIAANLVITLGVLLRLCLYLMVCFLLCVAERTFEQRLQYAKHFCYLTSSRRARKYTLPHFRLNKGRNIKFWLSLRSYIRRRGPQRAVDAIVTAAFYLVFTLASILCGHLLQSEAPFLSELKNWDLVVCSAAMGVFLLRFLTIGTKITKKYRNLSVLITEQINLYLAMEKKPHKKEELMSANCVLKLAEELLKELDGPFRVCGWSINPVVYNILKVVILSACSAVLSEFLGFKLKLYKIKLNPINW